MNALLSIGWEPELRGLLTVIIGVVALCGSVYLLLATNMGIRLGFLVALAGLFGWMASMGAIWWTYGIGLKGNEPSWKPAEPFTIVREGPRLLDAEVLDAPVMVDAGASFVDVADQTREALVSSGWTKLPEDDRGRGQAIAAADEIIQVDDDEAIATSHRLASEEGILGGISAGANVAAALEVAARPEFAGKRIVTVICDSGDRYMSLPFFAP